MDMILAAITVASLTLAATMSLIAWRLIRTDRVRATARMDALRAMASRVGDEADKHVDAPREVAGPDIVHETAFAGTHDDDEPVAIHTKLPDTRPPSWDVLHTDTHHDQFQHVSSLHREEMFDKGAEAGVSGRRWLALAAVALLMAAGVATVSALNSPEITAAVAASRSATTMTEQGMIRPLELLSLRHEREVNGTFSVAGLVENPADSQAQTDVVAVVYLFDGGEPYFATARARLDQPVLAPGDRSAFVVKIAGVRGVQRYRVGFQRGEEGSIMHVDRRGQAPDTTTEAVASDDPGAPDTGAEDSARGAVNR